MSLLKQQISRASLQEVAIVDRRFWESREEATAKMG
jgi:hypothetical protein